MAGLGLEQVYDAGTAECEFSGVGHCAGESLVVAGPTELAPPGPHANRAAPAQDARYFLRNADGSMMTEEEAAPMVATMAAQDLAQERDRLQRAQEIERLVMEARGLRPPG